MVRFGTFITVAIVAALAIASAEKLENSAERQTYRMCTGQARYQVKFMYNWSGMTHPRAYPDGGMFAPTVLASHNRFYTMWAPGMFSNVGIQTIGETGNPMPQVEELDNEVNVFKYMVSDGPTGTGVITVDLKVRLKGYGGFTHISAAAMMAPSPDWFTGFYDIDMCNHRTGKWKKGARGYLNPWDAGTDSGTQFLSKDEPSMPRRPIRSLLKSRFMGNPVGTYRITKM